MWWRRPFPLKRGSCVAREVEEFQEKRGARSRQRGYDERRSRRRRVDPRHQRARRCHVEVRDELFHYLAFEHHHRQEAYPQISTCFLGTAFKYALVINNGIDHPLDTCINLLDREVILFAGQPR